jgi:hypothetical protein
MYTIRVCNIALLALTSSTILASGFGRSHRGHSMNVGHDGPVASCSELDWGFDDMEVAQAEQRMVLPLAQASHLSIQPPMNDGMQIQGWDRDEYSITACKAAGAATAEEARSHADEIKISVVNGRVQFDGPSGSGPWSVFLLVNVPRSVDLDLKTENGPIGLYEVQGHVKASATNGPITMRRCTGDIHLETENGPVSVQGGGGDVHVRTSNGPISLALEGERWEGGGFEASDQNGPLQIELPDRFLSGVRIESAGSSPWQCGGPCPKGQENWSDQGRTIEFGSGAAVVRLSTINGPVSIENPRGRLTTGD